MKKNDLLAILNNEEMSVEEKESAIQKLNGLDRLSDNEKHTKEIDELKASFETERNSWNEEKAKFEGYVTADEHKKALDELAVFQQEKKSNQRNSFLKGLGVLEGYEDFLASQFDWDALNYDEKEKTYSGEGLDEKVKALKEKYPLMYENAEQPTPASRVRNKGFYQQGDESIDLTNL